MKKVFIQLMLGTPFPWIEEYIENVQKMAPYGWEWKIFTPAPLKSKGNVEIVPFTAEQFCDLVEKKLDVRPNMGVTPSGVPSVHVSDFYVASGRIFEDYLTEADFWGITNLDVVYGRLDNFVPDSILEECDVFTDDVNTINGVFCLFRNTPVVNNLFTEIPHWQLKFSQPPCARCVTGNTTIQHTLFATDEYDLTEVMKNHPELRYYYPKWYVLHGHDRLEIHQPQAKLKIQEDGSLWELIADVQPPEWVHARPFVGREIMYYHFCHTKTWPII